MKKLKSILLAGAMLSATPAFAADKMTLLLDWFINPDHGPIILAEQLGYFKDQDLEVEIIPPADPADPPKLVAAKKAELAVSYQPSLHLQVEEGLPLKRVGTLVATPLNCLLVLKDGKIKNISDLKGKTVGFSVGGVEEATLGIMLKKHGLSLSDVKLVNVNFSLSPSLMSGQVDAVIGAYRNFELNQMTIEGVEGKCFYVEEEGLPAYDELIYVAHKDEMNKDELKRFMAATEKATQYMVNHPNKSWDLFKSYNSELDDRLNKMAWFDTLARFALRPTALDHGRYQEFEQFLLDAKLIKSKKSVDQLAIDISQ